MFNGRRSDYDVTNTVRVSSAADVRDAILALYVSTWPGADFTPVARASRDCEQAFAGHMPGYFGVDTIYHDQQHTLDVTLAMARLLAGYERTHAGTPQALGAERAAVGLLLALFHDIGYLRVHGEEATNGAEFTRTHVSRSARFMERYLPKVGLGHWTRLTSEIVHYTGYEKSFEQIGRIVTDPRDVQLGHLLGTGLLDDAESALIAARLTSGSDWIFLGSHDGQAIRFNETHVRPMGRPARGVRGMDLAKNDYIVGAEVVGEDGLILSISEMGYGKRTRLTDYRLTNRGVKGVINMKVTRKTGSVEAILSVKEDSELMIITREGKMIRIDSGEIRQAGRSTQGVRLVRMEDKDTVAAASLIPESEKPAEGEPEAPAPPAIQ